MHRTIEQSDDTVHPSPEDLTAFGQGRASGRAQYASIEQHLETCSTCCDVLTTLPADDFIRDLRKVVRTAQPEDSQPAQAARLGHFETLHEIGRGGAGTVFCAKQDRHRELVALKFLRSADFDPESLKRFRREADVLRHLAHPGIVRILDSGEQGGRPYLAMQLVSGGTLQQRLKSGPLPPHDAAVLVSALAEAVEYAHRQGVLHRDLKPSNILLHGDETLTEKGAAWAADTTSTAQPVISDFGLARFLQQTAQETRSGFLLGTPAYMAPEQAEGRMSLIGPATDVYALGAILYECLTGRPPFAGECELEILDNVRRQEPVLPSAVQAGIPRALDAICRKCLAKEISRRYASADELRDDLKRFLAREPVSAAAAVLRSRRTAWCLGMSAAACLVLTAAALVVLNVPGSRQSVSQDATSAVQAGTVYESDFETGVGDEWSGGQQVTPPSQSTHFLGALPRHVVQQENHAHEILTLRLHDLPAHNRLRLSFDMYVIGSWDGEGIAGDGSDADIFTVDHLPVAMLLNTTFTNRPGVLTTRAADEPGVATWPAHEQTLTRQNSLGYSGDGDSTHHFEILFDHDTRDLLLTFHAYLRFGADGNDDESWGLDNVVIRAE